PADMARQLMALGATKADAVTVAKGMARRGAMTEITAIRRVDGVTDRAPGGVAVYDTAFGRIMATPSTSADGALWATLTPATPQRMTHALKSLGLE
ncbi:ESX secretion-associated protein EspG, partial [Staphylococcus capitis]|nr:ESX secretion-associated protein EspG [Staphylococcus capitis]